MRPTNYLNHFEPFFCKWQKLKFNLEYLFNLEIALFLKAIAKENNLMLIIHGHWRVLYLRNLKISELVRERVIKIVKYNT